MQPPLPAEAVRELVASCLYRDPVAADLRCSLFVAASQSYKRDSLLRPFPPRYLRGDIKDFEELVRTKASNLTKENAPQRPVPSSRHWVGAGKSLVGNSRIRCLLLQLADVKSLPGVRELVRLRPREGEHHLALAHWILSSKSFAVKTLQKDEVRSPTHVFKPGCLRLSCP